jgi:hypothetical protein
VNYNSSAGDGFTIQKINVLEIDFRKGRALVSFSILHPYNFSPFPFVL